MPFTPFHLGAGATFKALSPKYCSFTMFGFTQVIIDTESLYYMVQGLWPIHRFFHTYLGATLVALFCLFVGRPLCEAVLRVWNWRLSPSQRQWLHIEPKISWSAAAIGAFLGAYSHVLLDSIMHTDARPFAPFSDTNGMLHIISVTQLHVVCVGLGIVGGLVLVVLLLRRKMARG